MKFLSTMMSKKKTALFGVAAAIALSVALCAGCGGGGGGGGGGSTGGGGGAGGGTGGGGGSSDTTAPTLSMAAPAASALVSDVDFATTAFYISFNYSDNSTAPNASTIAVSLTMDPGMATEKIKDISAAFAPASAAAATTIRSGASLYTILFGQPSPIFLLPSNDKSHTMKINATVRDAAGNPGFASSSFTVYPIAPPGQ